MANERVYTARRSKSDSEAKLECDIVVQWGRGQPETLPPGEEGYGYVTLSLVPRTGETPTAYCHLPRQQLNQLIRTLRRARNVAYETDE